MKFMRLMWAVVAAAALLASCYMMPSQSTGKINFSVSQSKSITTGSTLVRVSLFSVKNVNGSWVGQSLYSFSGGQTYVQGSVGGTISLTNIPAGTWAILVSAGYTDGSGNFVTTDFSWPYSVVSVAPGQDNPVTVTLQKSPAAATTLYGTNVVGVTNVNGTVYSVTASQLYSVSGATATSKGNLPGGISANAVDAGYYVSAAGAPLPTPYIDTNAGVYYYTTAIQSNLAASNPISMLQSAAFLSGGNIALFYQNQTGFGGAYLNSSSYSSGMWVNLNSAGEIPGKPIYDFTVSNAYAYIASKLGAFFVNQSVVQSQANANNIISVAKFFPVPDGSTILSLNADTADTKFYIGTSMGAWAGALADSVNPPYTGLAKVAPTSGDSIIKIASTTPGYVAFLSQYNLYIVNTTTGTTKTYPFYCGLPGQLTAMAWSATGPILYIAGSASTSTGSPGGLVSISGAGLP